MEQYGCHFRHQQIEFKEASPFKKFQAKASIQRSDTFDVLHYDIELDLTKFDNKVLYGQCEVLFKAQMDNINTFSLDLLDMDIDSVFDQNGPLAWSRDGFIIHMDLGRTINKWR